MADSTLNYFVASGTNAERLTFTPTPPSPANAPPHPGYFFYETDTGNTYSWDGAAWQPVGGAGGGGVALSAGTQSVSTGTVVFSNSNGVTFGMSGSSRITASVAAQLTGFAVGNTTGESSSSSLDARSLSFDGAGNVSVGYSGGSIVISGGTAAPSPVNFSAGTTSNNLGTVVFSNSNNVSFGLNGSTITATASVATSLSNIRVSAGTTSNLLSDVTFANSNGVSWGLNASTITATVKTDYLTNQTNQTVGIYASSNTTSSVSSGTVDARSITFVGKGGLSVGYSNGSVILSGASGGGGGSVNFSAGTTSSGLDSVVFSNSNGVSFGLNGSTITATVSTYNTTSFDTVGIATTVYPVASANSTGTVTRWAPEDHRHAGVGGIGISTSGNTAGTTGSEVGTYWFQGGNNITLSQITSNNGSHTLVISGASAAASPVNFSAGTTSNNLATVVFSNSNGVSFGLNGSTITATVAAAPAFSAGVSTDGNTLGNTGTVSNQIVLEGINGITLSQSTDAGGATVTFSGAGYTLSTYEPFPVFGPATSTVAPLNLSTSGRVHLVPFNIHAYVSAGILNLPLSLGFLTVGTSSGRETWGMHFGLYTRTGSTLSVLTSASFSVGITGNNSTYSFSHVTTTNYTGFGGALLTTSAGVNISSFYTGLKNIGLPINSLLSPGAYWFALMQTSSTSSTTLGIQASYFMADPSAANRLVSMAPLGSLSSAGSATFDPVYQYYGGVIGSWSTAGNTNLPNSIHMSNITGSSGQPTPFLRFWST